MTFRSAAIPALLVTAVLALSGCESAEERAERHFQSGMTLLEDGDVARALVEFRNVFKLDGTHREARKTYARIQRERGEVSEAFSQYLRLVEQYPRDLDGRRALGEIAVAQNDWTAAARHIRAAVALAPEDVPLRALEAALDYQEAVTANDAVGAAAALKAAREVLGTAPEELAARRVVIDHHLRDRQYKAALDELDTALEFDPDDIALHETRIAILVALQDIDAVGRHLKAMFERFPDERKISEALLSWHLRRGDVDGAERFLRHQAGAADPLTAREAKAAVVQLLLTTQGPEAARAELDRLIAAGGETALFRSLRASIDFDTGDRAGAIAEMEALQAELPSSKLKWDLAVALAQMRSATGDSEGARAEIETVLAADPTHVAALRMRAARLIREDRTGEAIGDLRNALGENSRDPEALTLMAEAHMRAGSRELAGERLALAVEAAGRRPAESLRYAQFLVAEGRLKVGEAVLVDALRLTPNDPALLAALGGIYRQMPDWPRLSDVIRALDRIDLAAARQTAARLRIALYAGRDAAGDAARLRDIAEAEDAPAEAIAAVVRALLRAEEPGAAAAFLEARLAERTGNTELRLLRARLHGAAGETGAAEAIYRALVAEAPDAVEPVVALYQLLRATDRADEAKAVLAEGLAATGDAPALLLVRAGELEAAGEIDAAIGVYETLYARDNTDPVVANNLASLIATHRDDAESLERAFTIARRFRGTDVPHFQDTYGWIAYRLGNFDEARTHLEPAAARLAGDPVVQLHLGLTYAALNRPEAARPILEQALEQVGDRKLPAIERARSVLNDLGDPADAL